MEKEVNTQKAKTRPGLQVWGIPPATHNAFKAACAAKGRTIKEVIQEFMEEFSKK